MLPDLGTQEEGVQDEHGELDAVTYCLVFAFSSLAVASHVTKPCQSLHPVSAHVTFLVTHIEGKFCTIKIEFDLSPDMILAFAFT